MKKTLTSALAGVALAGLVGCSSGGQEAMIRNMPEAKGYDVYVEKDNDSSYGHTKISVGVYNDTERHFATGLLIGDDFGNDGRIDAIRLSAVPKGSQLEELANVKELDEILRAASKQLK